MELFPFVFLVYWLAVLCWTLLVARLHHGLRTRHPLVYQTLGRPAAGRSLGSTLGVGAEVGLLRFLLARRYRFLRDPALTRLCGTMRVLLVGYAAFFLTVPVVALG